MYVIYQDLDVNMLYECRYLQNIILHMDSPCLLYYNKNMQHHAMMCMFRHCALARDFGRIQYILRVYIRTEIRKWCGFKNEQVHTPSDANPESMPLDFHQVGFHADFQEISFPIFSALFLSQTIQLKQCHPTTLHRIGVSNSYCSKSQKV